MTDRQLVTLAQSGHSQAVGQLYDKYFDPIYRFCYWQTGQQKESAQDLTQDIFLEMARSIKSFKGNSSFKNWLYGIAKIKLTHWIKQKYQLPQQPLFDQIIDQSDWIDPNKQAQAIKQVEKLLTTLSDQERAVMKLRYLRNYSVKEAAEELNLSESNVKVIAHRSLKKLRKEPV